MLKFNKLYLFIFFFVLFNNFCGQQLIAEPVESSINTQDIVSDQELDQMLAEINDSDFNGLENSEFVEFFKNPADMAEKLPESLKEQVLTAWEASGNVAGKIMNPEFYQNPILPVLELCNLLKTNIEQQELVEIILQIDTLLGSQTFISAMTHNLFGEKIKRELSEKLNLLEDNLVSFNDYLDSKLYENLLVLKDIILAFKTDDYDLFFESIEKYASQERIKASLLFNNALQELEDFLKTAENEDVKKAALFFKEDIFDSLKPLMSAIDEQGKIDQLALSLIPFGEAGQYLLKTLKIADKTSKISPAMLLSYGFYKKFLNYYLMDNGYSLKLLLGDSVISTAMLPIYILKKISDINKLRGKASQAEISIAVKNVFAEISEFYFDPNFLVKKSKWPMRSVYRIGSALAYYNFYRNHFSLNDTDFPRTYRESSDHINNLNEKNNPNYRYWPKEFKHFKNSIWFSLKDGYSSLGNFAERQIYSRVDNDLLNKIESHSLGLIKPELITFGLNTAMPLLTSKYFPKSIANLDKETVFSKEKPLFFNPNGKLYNRVVRPLGFGFGYLGDSDSIYYVGNRNYSDISDAQYIEGRALGYLSVTLGTYFGKKASLRFKKQFGYVLGKLIIRLYDRFFLGELEGKVRFLEKAGFDFNDMSQDKKKLAALNEMLKANIPALFSDELGAQVGQVRGIFFSILVESKTFTQEELAEFEKEMIQGTASPEKIDVFSNKIMDALMGGIAQKIGGFAGGFSSWLVTDMLVKKHTTQSPIYQQVLNRFRS